MLTVTALIYHYTFFVCVCVLFWLPKTKLLVYLLRLRKRNAGFTDLKLNYFGDLVKLLC